MPETDGRSAFQISRQIGGVWAVQTVQVVAQLGYAAVTGRVIGPAGFGAYAVALAIYGFVGLVAVLGLGNAAARRPSDDPAADRRLVSYSLLVGGGLSLTTALAAELLSRVWAAEAAIGSIRLVSVAIAFLPWATVLGGILRRQGRIGTFNRSTLAAGLLSVGLGVVAVVWVRQPWSLVAAPVLNQILLAMFFARTLGLRAVPATALRGGSPDIRFGLKSMALSALNQFAYYLPLWSMSRVSGPVVFGSWNRAVVVGQLPLESANRAAVTVVFPLFRHSRDNPGAARMAWTDMLSVAALIVMPLSGLAMPLLPATVEVVLGPQWSMAGSMAIWLWAAAAVTVLRTLLAAALESSNRFGPLWFSQSILAGAYVFAAVAVWRSGDWLWFAAGLVVAAVLSHAVQIQRAGSLLDKHSLIRWYGGALLSALVTGGVAAGIAGSGAVAWMQLVIGGFLGVLFLGGVWVGRGSIGPLRRLGISE